MAVPPPCPPPCHSLLPRKGAILPVTNGPSLNTTTLHSPPPSTHVTPHSALGALQALWRHLVKPVSSHTVIATTQSDTVYWASRSCRTPPLLPMTTDRLPGPLQLRPCGLIKSSLMEPSVFSSTGVLRDRLECLLSQ